LPPAAASGPRFPQAIILFRAKAQAEELPQVVARRVFEDDYYIEIQHHGLMNFDAAKTRGTIEPRCSRRPAKLAMKVITNDSHYVDQTDRARSAREYR
jgi:DNA polymerase-3 subunit alpha